MKDRPNTHPVVKKQRLTASGKQKLIQTYKDEKNARVKERLQLVKRVLVDGEKLSDVAESLERAVSFGIRWLHRFKKEGVKGLHDRPRSGRPPKVKPNRLKAIRKTLANKPGGYTAKAVMELIEKRTGVKYHPAHIYRLLRKFYFSSKVPRNRFINSAPAEEKEEFQKAANRIIKKALAEGKRVIMQDESIFPVDGTFHKKRWTEIGVRPTLLTNGTRQKTIVFGALTDNGDTLIEQFDKFNQYSYMDFLDRLVDKFGEMVLFVDRAPQHRSKMVMKYLEDNDKVTQVLLPKGSPEFNPVEEIWRQGKYEILACNYQPSLKVLKLRITKFFKNRKFDLDILKYINRKDYL